MDNLLMPLVAVVAIGFVIVRRFLGVPLVAKDVFLSPVVFLAIGLWSLREVEHWATVDASLLAVGLGAGLVFGALRGTTTRLYTRDGALHQRYRVWTLVVWGIGLAVSLGLYLLGQQLGAGEHSHSVMLSTGVGLLGEMITCGARALATGKPFSPPADGRETARLSDALDKVSAPERSGELTSSPTFREAVGTLITHHRGASAERHADRMNQSASSRTDHGSRTG